MSCDKTSSSSADSGVMHLHGLHRLLHPLWFTPVHASLARERSTPGLASESWT